MVGPAAAVDGRPRHRAARVSRHRLLRPRRVGLGGLHRRQRGRRHPSRARLLDRLGQGRVLASAASCSRSAVVLLVVDVQRRLAARRRRTPPRPWPARCCRRSARACAPAGPTSSTGPPRCRRPTRSRPWSTRRSSSSARSWSPCWPPLVDPARRASSPPAWPAGGHPGVRRPATHRAPAHPSGPRPPAAGCHCRGGPLAPLAVVWVALGLLFGAAEVATVAFAEEHGSRRAGLLLALWALGSLLAGAITGAVHLPSRAHPADPVGYRGARGGRWHRWRWSSRGLGDGRRCCWSRASRSPRR